MINTLYWIWLQQRIGYASRYAAAAMELPGGAAFIYERTAQELYSLGVFPKRMTERLADKDLSDAEQILKNCIRCGYDVITPESELYPQRLRNIADPPLVLYVSGKLPRIDEEAAIAIVGTRSASQRGLAAARELGMRLGSAGAVVVSGCAMGIDMASQEGAITAEGTTVGVLGCGLDSDYNYRAKELRELITLHGALVSEYPPETGARREYFPQRNRIISGLSLGVAVIEAGSKSGSSITARLAVEQGRDLFAMPGPAGMENSEGVNRMIACGAKTLLCPADILVEYEEEFSHKIHFEGTNFPLLGQPGDESLSAERALKRGIERNRANKAAARKARAEILSAAEEPNLFEMAEKMEQQTNAAQLPVPTDEPKSFILPDDVSAEARALYDAMSGQPQPIDELAVRLGLSAQEISMLLFELEMNRAVISHPGKRCSRREKED